MKINSKIIFLLFTVAGLFASCNKDFLDRPPLSEISTDNFYQTASDLKLATAALYAGTPWADWTYSSYLTIGDVMSGNMVLGYNDDAIQLNTFSVTGLNSAVKSNWSGMYKVIAHCNTTINSINEKTPESVLEEEKNAALAEARFIRGYAYYNLAVLWGDVPIIEDNTLLISSPLVSRIKVSDVYQFVVNDLTYAAKNLPFSVGSNWEKGRVTSWSAQGLLAKVYLTWSGLNPESAGERNQALLDSAKLYAGNVCINSGLELMNNYADLFKTENNFNDEALFALRWDPSVGSWLEGNMLQIYSPGGTEISADGQAGWYGIAPTYDMFLQYSEKDTIRRKATYMYKNDYYPELNAAGGGYTYTGDAGLKKHIIGTKKDNNLAIMTLTSSAEHNALLRLSDVYLVYAEAILGNNATTSDVEALMYFNKVRTRAGVDAVTTLDGDLLLKERRIELAAEGQFWFDLVSLSYYNTEKAVAFLNNQERVTFKLSSDGVATAGEPFGVITPASANSFKLPIPSSEITANPKLSEPPVSYSF
ncbi:RagB/SusD family nutrient uptake outer membrane protein [Labilibaculum sp. K2S]|uniref:RagB/SusD family nutrient uptake outer membrane protein n=1 Tax=Labilibaculum sp. K2S TaxID=3056386 RepID=UPI0025A43262|nr:RagB/SusD family nutrient uptake outer membrane protein [Labilibaculum sp. K2S]MDM8159973.1 RagB/SusD family nutrient uptake outer membrane protein [Labilibaculum sp. K2S]